MPAMFRGLLVLIVVALTAPSLAAAETISFGGAAGLLAKSCAAEIDANCRGVNLDPQRMKDCLLRNQDVLTPQCKNEYSRAFDAIQKRVAARVAVFKLCERDMVKLCPGVQKGDRGAGIDCLLAGPRGIGINCGKSLGEAGYR
jgi:hypothetical protein